MNDFAQRREERAAERQARRDAFQERIAQRRERKLRNPAFPPRRVDTAAGEGGNTAQTAFDTYLNSTGYKFRLGEGYDAINANYAARGSLESGAAQKALLQYGQDYGSNEFNRYLSSLGGMATQGTGAASALAGATNQYAGTLGALNSAYAANTANAGNNLAGTVTGLNTNLANAQGQAAANTGQIYSNAAIANANNTNSTIAGIGNSVGGALGYLAYN